MAYYNEEHMRLYDKFPGLTSKAPVNMNFAIQWSYDKKLWHCVYCHGLSRNAEYDDLIHVSSAKEGKGNRLIHATDCRYLIEYRRQEAVKASGIGHFPGF